MSSVDTLKKQASDSEGSVHARDMLAKKNSSTTVQWDDSESNPSSPLGLKTPPARDFPDELRAILQDPESPKRSLARRQSSWWSEEEEDALYRGVARFGQGSWKTIKEKYAQFANRTAVDLKDKWRNLSKKSNHQQRYDRANSSLKNRTQPNQESEEEQHQYESDSISEEEETSLIYKQKKQKT